MAGHSFGDYAQCMRTDCAMVLCRVLRNRGRSLLLLRVLLLLLPSFHLPRATVGVGCFLVDLCWRRPASRVWWARVSTWRRESHAWVGTELGTYYRSAARSTKQSRRRLAARARVRHGRSRAARGRSRRRVCCPRWSPRPGRLPRHREGPRTRPVERDAGGTETRAAAAASGCRDAPRCVPCGAIGLGLRVACSTE